METLSSLRIQSWLSWFLRGLTILGFLILFARLFELTTIKGSYYRSLSEGNRVRRVSITAPRGKIIARGGEILVGNREVKKKIIFDSESGYTKTDIDDSSEREIDVITEYARDYPLGPAFAHVSGYLGETNQDEVEKINPECLQKGVRRVGSLVGRAGLEEEYECILSGVDGEELIEVDTAGRKIRTLGKREPVEGTDIKTSISFPLQQKVAQVMREVMGAAIVSDPEGRILAFYSSPSYDPNTPASYLNDPDLPLFNRAIGGLYHPGSVFKPLVAIAALSEGTVDKDFLYEDTGVITIAEKFSYTNWYFNQYGGREGSINVVRALARSTDTFFYKLGELLGIRKLVAWADKFGISYKTGIDIPGEVTSLVPTPEWKLEVKGEPWFLGNTYHMSIGQGDLAVTPISIHRMFMTLASGGKVCSPKVMASQTHESVNCKDLGVEKEVFDTVKEGMEQACELGGTGFTFFDFEPRVACKTGTAETNEDGKTHAWFSVFAPSDNPEIVATILVEAGGEGSRVAGPLARELFDFWFHP